MKRTYLILTVFLTALMLSFSAAAQEPFEECTAGVACGKATTDGRPLLWKTRDADAPDNEIIWNTTGKYHFVSVISAGSPGSSWMGVNEKGFSIINTQSTDLERASTGPGNGVFMVTALRECATVDEFEELLKKTNVTGRQTQTNYGVIDATGAAAFFETAGTQYWRFDAEDAEHGYIVRTNFAYNGKRDGDKEPGSMDRFVRSSAMMKDFYATNKIDFKEISRIQVRNFGGHSGLETKIPFADSYGGHPYGYFPNNSSICRNSSVSFSVIQGVLPGEPPELSTMWTILGQPATSVLAPYWPVGETPAVVNGDETAPLCDAANDIRAVVYASFGATKMRRSGNIRPLYIDTYKLRDGHGGGIWTILFPAEDKIIREAEAALDRWRRNMPSKSEVLALEARLAGKALEAVKTAYQNLIIDP